MKYIPKSRRIHLYRIISADAADVEMLRKEGIKASHGLCLPGKETEPRRQTAVFAYTLKTLEKIVSYGEATDVVVEFIADAKDWLVGDLRLECTELYPKTVRSLMKILENLWMEDAYQEMEVFFPNGHVEADQIINVKKRKDFAKEKTEWK
jgi:hypothetical protein